MARVLSSRAASRGPRRGAEREPFLLPPDAPASPERLKSLRDDYADLLAEGVSPLGPPSPDAQRVVELLSERLGGQAWSGWSWIQANVPKREARAAVRKAHFRAFVGGFLAGKLDGTPVGADPA